MYIVSIVWREKRPATLTAETIYATSAPEVGHLIREWVRLSLEDVETPKALPSYTISRLKEWLHELGFYLFVHEQPAEIEHSYWDRQSVPLRTKGRDARLIQ